LKIDYSLANVPAEMHDILNSENDVSYSKVELHLEFTINKGSLGVELYFEKNNTLGLFDGLSGVNQVRVRHSLGRVSAELLDTYSIV